VQQRPIRAQELPACRDEILKPCWILLTAGLEHAAGFEVMSGKILMIQYPYLGASVKGQP